MSATDYPHFANNPISETTAFVGSGKEYLKDTTIEDSRLYNCSIDAGLKRITRVGTPLLETDAVNLGYFQQGITPYTKITLIGTNSKVLDNSPDFGSYEISIQSESAGGPGGIWWVSKSSPHVNLTGLMIGPHTKAAVDDETEIKLDWPANSGIQFSKTTAECDGIYEVTVRR